MWKSCCSAVAVGSALWLGCGKAGDGGASVARVGDVLLTAADLEGEIADAEAEVGQRRQFVEDWVRQQLLYQEAVAQQVDQSPQVRRLLDQARRDLVVAAYLDQTFADRRLSISEADAERHYHLHAGEYKRTEPEIHARHILLASRRDAVALRQELVEGASFDERARDLSLDRVTMTRGGDLGYFTADEHPELWEACADLDPGDLSRAVETERGWHLVLLVDRQEAGSVRTFSEPVVREAILETLVRQHQRARLDSLLEQLRTKHSWHIDDTQLAQ